MIFRNVCHWFCDATIVESWLTGWFWSSIEKIKRFCTVRSTTLCEQESYYVSVLVVTRLDIFNAPACTIWHTNSLCIESMYCFKHYSSSTKCSSYCWNTVLLTIHLRFAHHFTIVPSLLRHTIFPFIMSACCHIHGWIESAWPSYQCVTTCDSLKPYCSRKVGDLTDAVLRSKNVATIRAY